MKSVENLLKETRENRRSHLKLDEDCIERGNLKNSAYLIGLVAVHLDTTVPISGYKIRVCHACNNPQCCNPNHLYFGSPKDNIQDEIENGTYVTIWEKMVKKYGTEEARKMNSKHCKKAGKLGGKTGKGKILSSDTKIKISKGLKKYYNNK